MRDSRLLLLVCSLTLFGLLMVTSASSVVAEQFRGDQYAFLKHQLIFGVAAGVVAFLVGYTVPYRWWRRMALPAILLALGLLVLVFVPGVGARYGAAARWIVLGPLSIQPTELTKVSFIVYLAALLEKKGEAVRDFRKSVVPFVVLVLTIGTLVALQPDMGTLFIITAIAGVMVLAAGFRWHHLLLMALSGTAIFGLLFTAARYRLARLIAFLHPELDPRGIGYQINQALLAVGTGGWLGLGLGRSRQKYLYLPEPATDSIFAIIAEELGLIGSWAVLAAFVVLAYRGYRIALASPDVFGRLLAAGITGWLVLQAFVNIGAITGLLPLTGVPLPFISYGGSALVSVLFASGVLLNISKYTA